MGKKFFHNIIEGSKVKAEPFYSAIITPVIHYCMGALEIDVTPQLLPSGEVAGVHGNNRLGGNSLLGCVVSGLESIAQSTCWVTSLRTWISRSYPVVDWPLTRLLPPGCEKANF